MQRNAQKCFSIFRSIRKPRVRLKGHIAHLGALPHGARVLLDHPATISVLLGRQCGPEVIAGGALELDPLLNIFQKLITRHVDTRFKRLTLLRIASRHGRWRKAMHRGMQSLMLDLRQKCFR